ncbi:MAG: hypothetical protein ACU0CA_09855 [Paracoccaceae bacterium]
MQVFIHIGLPHCGTARIQRVLADNRQALAATGVLYPRAAGHINHTRLFRAIADPDQPNAEKSPSRRFNEFSEDLSNEIEENQPEKLILSAHQLSNSLTTPAELKILKLILPSHNNTFHIIAYVDEQARVLSRHYAAQIMQGRLPSLQNERDHTNAPDWRAACLNDWPKADPALNMTPEIQSAPFWLDYEKLVSTWEDAFGENTVQLRPFDANLFASADIAAEIEAAFNLPVPLAPPNADTPPAAPSAQWLTRCRLMNEVFQRALQSGRLIPRKLRAQMLSQFNIPGPPLAPGSLHRISNHFAAGNERLQTRYTGLKTCLTPDASQPDWSEPPASGGFRATQYMSVFLPLIDQTTRQELRARANTAPEQTETIPQRQTATANR